MKLPRFEVLVSAPAAKDIAEILTWSAVEFGEGAVLRYEALLGQALIDLGDSPGRPGAKERVEILPGVYTYHLAFSRDRVAGRRVKRPRHFVLYRVAPPQVEVSRILHDSCDLERHLPDEYR